MLSLRQKFLDALAAAFAILTLGLLLDWFPNDAYVLPLMASMGASAFLLFVLPHSPMAQPWPLLGGHLVAALAAMGFHYLIDDAVMVAAASVGASVLAMQVLRCIHPPAAATALAVAMSDIHLDDQAWEIVSLSVMGGALVLLLLAWMINNLLLGKRYPLRHSHHPHHEGFRQADAQHPASLEEEDISWALEQMDGIIDATTEDLIDIYEFALEHARNRTGDRKK